MARDEARHSSFLNFVMRQMGRRFDLKNLPNVAGMQYMHPKWIFVTTYLSEIVGFYRYQNISDHLKRHPEHSFHPIFRYFDNWCKDERRHSKFFALMLRSQPDYIARQPQPVRHQVLHARRLRHDVLARCRSGPCTGVSASTGRSST